jgi:rod shape-determining protein MreC
MESFLSRYKNALVLVTVLLVQVFGLAVQVRRPAPDAPDGRGARLIRYWVMSLIAPPERLLHATGGGIRGIWSTYIDLIHVHDQNEKLKAEIDRLRLEEASLTEDARQGQRLQGLLGFREHYIYQTVPAQVIGASGTEDSHVLIIDKGAKDGIRLDMPVITPDGIVGKTREVFDHSSQVLEISDSTSGAGVILQTTRIRGVLRGSAWGQPQIVNVSPDDRIKAGEPVVTSGGDAIFPRGLAVGTVERSVPDPDGTLMDVLIRPAANLSRLEEVLVITNMGDQIPGQTQLDIAESEQQKASDILAERLPSREDANAPQGQQTDELAGASADGDVARPIRPPAALRPDVFTPGYTPPAAGMTPGARLGRVLSGEGQPQHAPARQSAPVTPVPAAAAAAAAVATPSNAHHSEPTESVHAEQPEAVHKQQGPVLVHDYSGATPPQYQHPAEPRSVSPAASAAKPHMPATPPNDLHPASKTTIIVDGPAERPAAQHKKPAPPTTPATPPQRGY